MFGARCISILMSFQAERAFGFTIYFSPWCDSSAQKFVFCKLRLAVSISVSTDHTHEFWQLSITDLVRIRQNRWTLKRVLHKYTVLMIWKEQQTHFINYWNRVEKTIKNEPPMHGLSYPARTVCFLLPRNKSSETNSNWLPAVQHSAIQCTVVNILYLDLSLSFFVQLAPHIYIWWSSECFFYCLSKRFIEIYNLVEMLTDGAHK